MSISQTYCSGDLLHRVFTLYCLGLIRGSGKLQKFNFAKLVSTLYTFQCSLARLRAFFTTVGYIFHNVLDCCDVRSNQLVCDKYCPLVVCRNAVDVSGALLMNLIMVGTEKWSCGF